MWLIPSIPHSQCHCVFQNYFFVTSTWSSKPFRFSLSELNRASFTCSREIKLRRAVEETGKQLETERTNLENALRHVAQEREDLKKLLEREQEQSRRKDELYREQKKQNEAIMMESRKVR